MVMNHAPRMLTELDLLSFRHFPVVLIGQTTVAIKSIVRFQVFKIFISLV